MKNKKLKVFSKVLAAALLAPLFLASCNNKPAEPSDSHQSSDSTVVTPVKNTVSLKEDKNFKLNTKEVSLEDGKAFTLEVPDLERMYEFEGWYTEQGDKITDGEGNSIEPWDEAFGDITLVAHYYGKFTYEDAGDGLRVLGNEITSELDEIVIPDEHNGKKILEVGDFSDHKFAKRVSLPNTVTLISETAFSKLTEVKEFEIREIEGVENPVYTSVDGVIYADEGATLVRYPMGSEVEKFTVPATVTKIAPHAFESYLDEYNDSIIYSELKEVNLPATITEIGDFAFYQQTGLKTVKFAQSTTALKFGAFAFSGVPLTNFELPKNLVSIGESCFASDFQYTDYQPNWGDLALPEGLKEIGAHAFYFNQKINKITLPSSLTTIGERAFGSCSASEVIFPETANFDYISDSMFLKSDLAKITIPSYIKTIGANAFADTNLVDVILPSGVTTIGERAFASIDTLEGFSIPNTVTSFGDGWIAESPNLKADKIVSDSTILVKGEDGVIYNAAKTEIFLYPSDLQATSYVMPDTVKVMPEYMFAKNPYIKSVKLSANLEYIPAYAFYACGLETVEVPASVTRINESAFSKGTVYEPTRQTLGVKNVTFAENSQLKVIGKRAFDSTLIKNITLPEGVEVIEDMAFTNAALEVLNVPASIKSIEPKAFGGFQAKLKQINVAPENTVYKTVDGILYDYAQTTLLLFPKDNVTTELVLPETVTTIGDRGFYKATKLTKVSGANVTTLKDGAFDGAKVKVVDLPKVTFVGEKSLYNMSKLESIDLTSVTHFGANALSMTSAVKNFAFNDKLEYIGFEAFTGTGLTEVNIPGSCKVVGERAFAELPLTKVTLGEGVERVETGAFEKIMTISELKLPKTLRYIGASAFTSVEMDWSDNITAIGGALSELVIPEGVKYIEPNAFFGNAFTKISVDANNRWFKNNESNTMLLSKDGSTLYQALGNKDLKELVIEDGIKDIKDGAFSNYYFEEVKNEAGEVTGKKAVFAFNGVKGIKVPASLESISSSVFSTLTGLESVTIDPESKFLKTIDGVLTNYKGTKLIYYPATKVSEKYVIPESVTEIGAAAFAYVKTGDEIKEIVFGENVKVRAKDSFTGCKFETVEINGQEMIDQFMFPNLAGYDEFGGLGYYAQTVRIKKGLKVNSFITDDFELVPANQTVEGYDVYTRIPEPTPEA